MPDNLPPFGPDGLRLDVEERAMERLNNYCHDILMRSKADIVSYLKCFIAAELKQELENDLEDLNADPDIEGETKFEALQAAADPDDTEVKQEINQVAGKEAEQLLNRLWFSYK